MSRWIVQTNLITKTAIVLLFFGTPVFASPFFGSAGGNTTNTPSAPLQSASSPHILSPNEFSSKVNTLSQSVNTSLAQQASAALPKKNTTQNANMSATTNTSTNTTTAAAPTSQPPTSIQPPPLQNAVSSLPAPNTTLSSGDNETTSTTSAAPSAPTYSGFGVGNNNNPTPHPTQGGSTGGGSGWSVQY